MAQSASSSQNKSPRDNMNNMYKLTRHVYDASRKFYLFGRDYLIENLNPHDGDHIIEIGCGTARNLIKMAYKYPQAHFYGLDASDEMLKTARQSLLRLQLADRVPLMQGLAQEFDPLTLMESNQPPDKIVFSYVLSMIPDAEGAIDHALDILPSGGEIHIVDFCHLKRQPAAVRMALQKWLALFHVHYNPKLLAHIKDIGAKGNAEVQLQSLYKDYAYYARIKKN